MTDDAVIGDSLPLRLLESAVPAEWIDYNGHMTEFRYAQVFSDSCEALLRLIGLHDDYVANGHSYYTVETHSQFFDEIGVAERYYTTAQIVVADSKRLHVYFCMHELQSERLLATLEAMYLHVDTNSGRVVGASDQASKKLMDLAAAHRDLAIPAAVGRFVGQRS